MQIEIFAYARERGLSTQALETFLKDTNAKRDLRLYIELNFLMGVVAESAFTEVFSYSQRRQQGGRKIIKWSGHQRQLARLDVQLRCWQHALKLIPDERSAMALHLQLSEQLPIFVSKCLELMGGVGYMAEGALAKIFRFAHFLAVILGPLPQQELSFLQGRN